MTSTVVPAPETLGDTQTLSFPPWFFQQVLNQSKHHMPGSVSDRAKARAPCRGILKAKNPHTVPSRRRVLVAEPGSDFKRLWGLQPLQPATHHRAERHQGPHPEEVSQVPQDTAPQGWTPFPTTGIRTKRAVPPRAGSSLRCQQEACGYQLHGYIYHEI